MAKELSIEEVIALLKEHCNKFPKIQDAATDLGCSRVFLWKVLNNQTPPPPSLLDKIGVKKERTITYKYVGAE
jgi:hypothetical protein